MVDQAQRRRDTIAAIDAALAAAAPAPGLSFAELWDFVVVAPNGNRAIQITRLEQRVPALLLVVPDWSGSIQAAINHLFRLHLAEERQRRAVAEEQRRAAAAAPRPPTPSPSRGARPPPPAAPAAAPPSIGTGFTFQEGSLNGSNARPGTFQNVTGGHVRNYSTNNSYAGEENTGRSQRGGTGRRAQGTTSQRERRGQGTEDDGDGLRRFMHPSQAPRQNERRRDQSSNLDRATGAGAGVAFSSTANEAATTEAGAQLYDSDSSAKGISKRASATSAVGHGVEELNLQDDSDAEESSIGYTPEKKDNGVISLLTTSDTDECDEDVSSAGTSHASALGARRSRGSGVSEMSWRMSSSPGGVTNSEGRRGDAHDEHDDADDEHDSEDEDDDEKDEDGDVGGGADVEEEENDDEDELPTL